MGSSAVLLRASMERRVPNSRFLGALLLATTLLLGAISAAEADEYVVFGDSSLRAAVVGQLVRQGQLPLGSDGTTIAPSDADTLTALSAPNQGIARLDGLQHAENLASLDLHGNEIADISALGGLTKLTTLDVSGNHLDVAVGTPAMSVIAALEGSGTVVSYGSQHAQLSSLGISSSAASFGKSVTFSARIAPPGAASSGASTVRLYHLETKTVTRKIKGKRKKFAVNYWRLRRTLAMRAGASGALSIKGKLPYAGKWQAKVAYAGSADYESCKSATNAFVVRDPRVERAIRWAMRRRGSHSWDHYCLRFAGDCYARGAGASVHRYDTARQAARALHATSHRSTNAPRGAWVFYDSTPGGHVGLSLGGGMMINDYGGAGVKVMPITAGGHYIGWAAPSLSPPIVDWKQPP